MQLCNSFVCVCLLMDSSAERRNVKISWLKNPPWFVSENNGVCELPPSGLHSVVMGTTTYQIATFILLFQAPLDVLLLLCVCFRASGVAEVMGRRSAAGGGDPLT